MTERRDRQTEPEEAEADDSEVRSWVKGALADVSAPKVDVLGGVQKKLRERSGGKFYADLWSTAKEPPTATFLVTSLLMLAMVLVLYAVLAPLRGKPEPVRMEPAPIDVVSPAPR